ncbi:hypothetical protein [Hippea sp. KM1]|uniref:hypothetical protein n=1 Tax=Hippea sp. KM1 TaxID=944481 RepID=UPI00046CF07E|nr:hypothetical protein [Hippea sp. KM1]
MNYILETEDIKTNSIIVESNNENLKSKYKEISINIAQEGKVIYRDTKATLYSNKNYIILKIPTEVKDHINRTIPLICVFSLKDIEENYKTCGLENTIDKIINIIENFSKRRNIPININFLIGILKNYLIKLISKKALLTRLKKNIGNFLRKIFDAIAAFFTSIFGIKR